MVFKEMLKHFKFKVIFSLTLSLSLEFHLIFSLCSNYVGLDLSPLHLILV